MFKDVKKKAEEIKRLAKEKSKNLTLSESKNKTKSMFESATQKTTVAIIDAGVTAKSAISSGKESAGEVYEKYGPAIEKVVVDGLLGIAEEKLQDEKFLKISLEKLYEVLPIPVRMIVSRDDFFDFCLARKEPILVKIKGHREVAN